MSVSPIGNSNLTPNYGGVQNSEPSDLESRVSNAYLTQQIREESSVSKEKEALEKVSGYLWKAIERISDSESGGYLYRFEARLGTDHWEPDEEKINIELVKNYFPALEATPISILKEKRDMFLDQNGAFVEPLAELGYEIVQGKANTRTQLTLPDTTVFMHRYAKIRERKPDLPKLSIFASKGIASDAAYVEGLLKHDVLCSDGKEFVHDMLTHMLPTVVFMHQDPELYRRNREFWTTIVEKAKGLVDDKFPNEKQLLEMQNRGQKALLQSGNVTYCGQFKIYDGQAACNPKLNVYKQLLFSISFFADSSSSYGASPFWLDSKTNEFRYSVVVPEKVLSA